MLSIIKLLFFLAIYLLVCESAGLRLAKKININIDIIALPIGMTIFGCLYEILVVPVQFFYLDSSLLKYALILTFVIIFVYGIKEIKNIIKHISKRDIILLLLFIIFFAFDFLDLDVYGNNGTLTDDLFYLPFVNGISIDGIQVNAPFSNLYAEMFNDKAHAFYGQLHLYGAISNLFKINGLITLNFFHRWHLIIYYITNIYNIYKVCVEIKVFKNINKFLVLLFIGASSLSVLYNNYAICVKTTAMLFIIAPLIFYLKTKQRGWLSIFSIYSFYAFSIRSTYIMAIGLLLLPLYFYLLINNKIDKNIYIHTCLPVLISLSLYMSYGKGLSVLIINSSLLFVIASFLLLAVKKVGQKKSSIIYSIILICAFLFFTIKSIPIGNERATWDGILIFDLLDRYFLTFIPHPVETFSLYYFSYLIMATIILIFNVYKKKELSYISIHIILIFVLFLNWLVAPFVNDVVYDIYSRLMWTWINPLFYLIALDEFISIFDKTNLKKGANLVLSVVLIINLSFLYLSEYIDHIDRSISSFKENKDNISLFYKVGRDAYEIGKTIEKYSQEKEKKYVKIALPINILNCTFVSSSIRLSPIMGDYYSINQFGYRDYYTEMWNEENYEYPIYFYLLESYRFFDDWHLEFDYDNIPDIQSLMKNSNTDIFIIKKWKNREETDYHLKEYFENFSSLVYENENYQVYVIN